MKGVVFDEFINMVEERFSLEMADRIINLSHLATGGAYTSVGTYDHQELIELISHLSHETGIAASGLLCTFGEYLFDRFCIIYPSYIVEHDSTFNVLANLGNKIHVEVKKLYPDAELPQFQHEFLNSETMILIYRSKRPLADLAEGLILGCIKHYAENIHLLRQDLPSQNGAHTRFTLTRQSSKGNDGDGDGGRR